MGYASSKDQKKDYGKPVHGYNEHVPLRGSAKASSKKSPAVSGFGKPAAGEAKQVPLRGGDKKVSSKHSKKVSY